VRVLGELPPIPESGAVRVK